MGWFEIYSTEATKAHTFKAETQTCFMLLFAMSLLILGVWALYVITETESLQVQVASSLQLSKCFELGFC